MIEKIVNHWIRRKTKNLTEIPLFTMTFDYRKYKAQGKKLWAISEITMIWIFLRRFEVWYERLLNLQIL